jgi:hypothetical protein
MRSRLRAACLLALAAIALSHAGDPKLRPYDGSKGFAVMPGTISPNGEYAIAYGSANLAPSEQAQLKEWPADLELNPEYRLKVKLGTGRGTDGVFSPMRMIVAGHKQTEQSEPERLDDPDVNEKLYKKLSAKLPPKARPALQKEQEQWVAWVNQQPEEAQAMIIIQRSSLVRARAEFGER